MVKELRCGWWWEGKCLVGGFVIEGVEDVKGVVVSLECVVDGMLLS